MILCVTPNPAWDVTYPIEAPGGLRIGSSHRVLNPTARAGGKGVNVASVLTTLGVDALIVAPVGGASTDAFAADLESRGLRFRGVASPCEIRRSIAVVDEEHATLFNEVGAPQPNSVWDLLLHTLEEELPRASALVVSGSLPPEAPTDVVRAMVRLARAADVPSLLDIRGPALSIALAAGPTLVKPNLEEATETTGLTDPLLAARALLAGGAESAAVSCGAEGVVWTAGDQAVRVRGPLVTAGNPTGAGDALCAGLALALARRSLPAPTEVRDAAPQDWRAELTQAMSYAVAAVHSPVAGDVDPALADRIRSTITLEELPCRS